MAINFKEHMAKLIDIDNLPLTEDELDMVGIIEEAIDELILKCLSVDNLEIWIDQAYIKFIYNPKNKRTFKDTTANRRRMMQEELLRRYKENNWEIKMQYDDGLEGNLSGPDYVILKGKK